MHFDNVLDIPFWYSFKSKVDLVYSFRYFQLRYLLIHFEIAPNILDLQETDNLFSLPLIIKGTNNWFILPVINVRSYCFWYVNLIFLLKDNNWICLKFSLILNFFTKLKKIKKEILEFSNPVIHTTLPFLNENFLSF